MKASFPAWRIPPWHVLCKDYITAVQKTQYRRKNFSVTNFTHVLCLVNFIDGDGDKFCAVCALYVHINRAFVFVLPIDILPQLCFLFRAFENGRYREVLIFFVHSGIMIGDFLIPVRLSAYSQAKQPVQAVQYSFILLQIFCSVSIIAFIVIARVKSFHINLSVADFIR